MLLTTKMELFLSSSVRITTLLSSLQHLVLLVLACMFTVLLVFPLVVSPLVLITHIVKQVGRNLLLLQLMLLVTSQFLTRQLRLRSKLLTIQVIQSLLPKLLPLMVQVQMKQQVLLQM